MFEIQLDSQPESETLFATQQEDAPFSIEMVMIPRQELIELKADKNRYRSLHQQTLNKCTALKRAT
jgi:hypothetical protein